MKFESRQYQIECADKALESILDKNSHPICAVPTGAGKTHIASLIIEKYILLNPDKSVIVLSHVAEILSQDYNALTSYLDEKIGLYSSMLKSKTIEKITVAGIQSVYRKPNLFGNVGLIIIDEAHLITDDNDGMYRRFIAEFNANYIGLTATPFRPRGYLHQVKNALFTEICYDLTSSDKFRQLIKDGFLCKLFSKATNMKMDVKDIKLQGGDYNIKMLGKKFNTFDVTKQALDETIKTGINMKKWLIFAIDIEHAESIQEYLNDKGINTGIVHSKMEADRKEVLKRFRTPFYRAVVNVNVLTTGLDIPDIDLIVLLRPTKSPVIYAQSVGRGLRVHPNKDFTLVLDFAGNVARHGPVDDITIVNKGEKGTGEAVTKECPACMAITHPTTKICEACGHEFEFKVNIVDNASELDILKQATKKWMNVNQITVHKHKKINKPASIRIDYRCGLRMFSQWAAINSNSGYAAHSAKYVLRKFYPFPEDFDFTIDNILEHKDEFVTPKRIYVDTTEKYPRIEEIDFGE